MRVLCFTSMSGGFLVCSFFRPQHAKIDFSTVPALGVRPIHIRVYIYYIYLDTLYTSYIYEFWLCSIETVTSFTWRIGAEISVPSWVSTFWVHNPPCSTTRIVMFGWIEEGSTKSHAPPILYCWSFHVNYCTPGFVQNYPSFFATLRCITFFAEGYASGHSIFFRSSIVSIRTVSKYRILHQTPKHITAEESAKPWGTNKFLHGSSNQKTTNHQPPHDTTITHPFRRLDLMAKFTMQATTGCTNEGTKGQAHISWTYLSWLRTSFRWGFSRVW